MPSPLTDQEIKSRLIRLQNLERLNAELKAKYRRLKQENTVLQETINTQSEQIAELRLQIEELQKMIFGRGHKHKKTDHDSQGTSKPKRKKPDRSPNSYRRPKPADDEITNTVHHLITNCPDCGSTLKQLKIIGRFVEDLLPPAEWHKALKQVVKQNITSGYCQNCATRKTAVPISPQEASLGGNVKQFVSFATVVLRLSYEQIKDFLAGSMRFHLSDGEIRNILMEQGITLHPEFEALKQRIRGQPGAHYDESSWPVQAGEQGNHVWVQTGTETPDTLFLFGRSRGKGNAEELRGAEDSHQTAITDDYAAYKTAFVHHQLCWAHPQRKLKDLARSEQLSVADKEHCQNVYRSFHILYAKVREIIASPFNLQERQEHKERLMKLFDEVAAPCAHDPPRLAKIKTRLRERKTQYLTCLVQEGIPCDNNKAERALRHIVLKRKNCFGSRTQQAADLLSVVYSVLLSLWWKSKETFFQDYATLLASA